MKLLKAFSAVLSIAALGALAVPTARADEWNEKTIVTFSAPIEVPGGPGDRGIVLPAGTYVFKLANLEANRNVVLIYNKNETHVFDTILAIPNYRLRPTSKTVIRFRESPVGAPDGLKAWFYPGDQYGQQFVYPRSRALMLAKAAGEPVLATRTEVARDEPAQKLKGTPVEAVGPSGETVDMATVVENPPASAQTHAQTQEAANNPPAPPAAKTLPTTASLLPLIGLVGLLSLGAGLGLKFLSSRTE